MKKRILTPIVMGVLASAVITGCSSSSKDSGEKKLCDYSIQGGNTVDIMFGTGYTNPSVKVTKDGKEVPFELEGTVNTNKLGTYKVTYTGKSCKNTQVRTVKVVPASCAYNLKGNNPFIVSLGGTFSEPGFVVKNINNKTIEGTVTGNVDTSKAGDYTLTYKGEGCKNSQTRIVKVTTGSCQYSLKGANPLTLNIGDTYNDPGVSVKDSQQKEITSSASGTVDTATVGNYTITYKGMGCPNIETRKVVVKSSISQCTYNVIGANPLKITQGDSYQEPGVSIQNAKQNNVTGKISGSVNTSKPGDYMITYKSDYCSNTATRTVKVVSADCSYTLSGHNPLILSKGDTFADPGVVVKNSNGSVVNSTQSGDIDTTKLGDYTLTYQGKGCANSTTRTVKVELQTCEYTLLGESPVEIILNHSYTDSGATIKDKSGVIIEAKAMGTGDVNTKKVGEYAVSYSNKACKNTADRIVKVRALTDDELERTILPRI